MSQNVVHGLSFSKMKFGVEYIVGLMPNGNPVWGSGVSKEWAVGWTAIMHLNSQPQLC